MTRFINLDGCQVAIGPDSAKDIQHRLIATRCWLAVAAVGFESWHANADIFYARYVGVPSLNHVALKTPCNECFGYLGMKQHRQPIR